MSFRKWLLTTVITGGLVAVSCGGAVAQSGKLLHPNSGWAVSKLAAAGAEPYCALARRFNGNIILTVARNASDESSVAIDFQRQALDNKQTYAVTLDPGFKQHRSYSVRPVSGKAMVVRLGQDYAFHDALNRSGKLAIDISGEVYSFHLPDFADGQSQLTGCLAGLVEPAAGTSARNSEPTPMPQQQYQQPPVQQQAPVIQQYAQAEEVAPVAPPVPAPAPVVSAPVTKVTEVANGPSAADLQSLREENTRLRNALERERRVYEDRFMQEGQSSSQVAELSERLQILERENNDLRQQLTYKPAQEATQAPSVLACATDTAAADEAAASSAALASMASEMDVLKEENQRLKREIQEQQAEMALMEQKIATVTAEASTADSGEVAAQSAIIDRLNGRVKVLEEENTALKTAQRQEAGASSVSLSQLRSLEEQLRYTQEDRDKLAKQVAAMADGKGSELMSISTSNWDLEQATARYNEAEKEIRRLSRQLQEQRTACAGEKKELEYMLFDPEVADEAQISRLIQLENQLDDISDRYAEQESRHEIEMERIKASQVASAETEKKLEALKVSMASLQKERKALEGERDNLAQTVSKLETSYAREQEVLAAERDQLQQKLAALESKHTDQQGAIAAERDQLRQKLAALESKHTDQQSAIAAERDQLQQKLASMEARYAGQSNVASAERVELEEKLASLEAKYSRENAVLVAERDELQQQLVALASQQSAQKDSVSSEREELMQKMSELEAHYAHEKELLEAERDELQVKVSSLESSLAQIQTASGGSSAVSRAAPAAAPAPVKAEPIAVSSSRPVVSAPADMGASTSAVDYERHEKTALYGGADTSVLAEPIDGVGRAAQSASTATSAVSSAAFDTAQDIGRILGQAQIPFKGAVKTESVAGGKAFSWDTGSLFGSAEELPMSDVGQFDDMAQAYLVKTKSRCGGEFAAVPVLSEQQGDMRVSAYDIACISDAAGASASILFYNKNGLFHAYAHETGLDSMDIAMDARDKLMTVLLGSDIAMR